MRDPAILMFHLLILIHQTSLEEVEIHILEVEEEKVKDDMKEEEEEEEDLEQGEDIRNGVLQHQLQLVLPDGHFSIDKWAHGVFNYFLEQGRPNNCGLLWLWVPGGKQEGQRIHGTFFAMECLTSPPDRWRGFLCGKRAT
uniref:C-type lectin domain-containing protein n=2 Tax=Caenorhabditis tropicalis TaxID=1561998 RepID=A0A1I7TEM6_9PELO